jgi:hypothetical protein
MATKLDDERYFEMRAEQEIERAQAAEHPAAVRAHAELAGYYLDRVHNNPGVMRLAAMN